MRFWSALLPVSGRRPGTRPKSARASSACGFRTDFVAPSGRSRRARLPAPDRQGAAPVRARRRRADRGQIKFIIKTGEHGDGNDLAPLARRSLGIFHHRAPACHAVDGDDGGFEHMDRLHRGGNGVGDVVQLEIEEDRQAELGDFMHAVVAVRAKNSRPSFTPPIWPRTSWPARWRHQAEIEHEGSTGLLMGFRVLVWWQHQAAWKRGTPCWRARDSGVLMRRCSRQRVARWISHIGKGRKAAMTSAGSLVSSFSPSQTVSSTGCHSRPKTVGRRQPPRADMVRTNFIRLCPQPLPEDDMLGAFGREGECRINPQTPAGRSCRRALEWSAEVEHLRRPPASLITCAHLRIGLQQFAQ